MASDYVSKDDFHREMQHYATKSDLAQMETRIIKWMVTLMVGSAAIATSLALLIERLIT